ncbi:AAA family ATPase [Bradyrhizobium sp.]|uniref:ATP-binding protein n=1 Tax=Bradyrhizobium sp. TaxID=376 RepID=UPI000AAADCCB|nr:AAA family ATPase [Bradyrhizobium sp.]
MDHPSRLKIRLLGELQLVGFDGRALALPASRKTRALLGYLMATGQPHRRERLCDLFWDGPDDPRAELRWSLSKIRSVLGDDGGPRLVADRERVGIELGSATVDLRSARSLLGNDVSVTSTDGLKEVASLFGGEFLDGLDLPLCYRYQEWCMAEREAVSRLHLTVLAALVGRLQDCPADALVYARTLATADPLSESGHAAVVRLLSREGRAKEALGHYEHARRLLKTELGVAPSEELERARQALQCVAPARASVQPRARVPESLPEPSSHPPARASFIGRETERSLIEQVVGATAQRIGSNILVVTGEAGIGKSHLLARIAERLIVAGGDAFGARAYEAEAARPYGVWIDILRAVARDRPRDNLSPHLGLLLPEVGVPPAEAGDQARLFDAVVGLLRQVASERPAAVTLDDIQWIDEASSVLLHYVARHVDAASGLLIACAARAGEIEDNVAASRVLRSLRREGRVEEIELAALSAAETAALVREIDPALDAARIFERSEGNPLFTLELARAQRRGDAGPGRTVETVIAGQLAQLTDQAREALVWAAAHGRAFTPDDLARAARLDVTPLLAALGELERRGLVRPIGGDAYDFTHDLIRQTAYRTVSQPRRTLLHRHIARVLDAVVEHDGALAADLAHHAALAGDFAVAVRACIVAAERALRQFANAEAAGFAERGLRHVERLPDDPAKPERRIRLLRIRVLAATGPGLRPLPPLAETIAEATDAAEKLELHAAAATGHYLLSVLHQEAGDTRRAERSTLRAAEAGRTADDSTRAHQLANTARCLIELETEIDRARDLIAEAGAIANSLGLELCELHWASGLLDRWDGLENRAIAFLSRALTVARRDEDRWREYKCLTWLAMLEQELARYAEMDARCDELKAVAARLGEDETPFVETLRALAALATETDSTNDGLARALARLRAVDDKSYLAYALNGAARLHRQAGRSEQARICAAEALTVASLMGRKNEIAIARALLAPSGEEGSGKQPGGTEQASLDGNNLSVRARTALRGSTALPLAIPTTVPTPDG